MYNFYLYIFEKFMRMIFTAEGKYLRL